MARKNVSRIGKRAAAAAFSAAALVSTAATGLIHATGPREVRVLPVPALRYSIDRGTPFAALDTTFVRTATGLEVGDAPPAGPEPTSARDQDVGAGPVFAVPSIVRTPASSNDDFADAVDMSPEPFNGLTHARGAGMQAGEPHPCGMGASAPTIWYRYRASRAARVTIDTKGSGPDTVLAVYTGRAVDALAMVGCNDDMSSFERASRLTFVSEPGTVYHVQIGVETVGGDDTVYVRQTSASALSHDRFDDARVITDLPFTDETSDSGAGIEPGEPMPSCAAGPLLATVWYRLRGGVDAIALSAEGNFQTTIAIYSGRSPQTLRELGCASGSRRETSPHSHLVAPARDQDLYLQLGSRDGAPGHTVSVTGRAVERPPNVDPAGAAAVVTPFHAQDLVALSGSGASAARGAACPARDVLWYRYDAERTGVVVADTTFSQYDTAVAAFDADTMRLLGCNDDRDAAEPASWLAVPVRAGHAYLFAVGAGPRTREASVGLVFSLLRVPPPPHDVVSSAWAVDTFPFSQVANTTFATAEPDEPGLMSGTVWYTMSARTSGVFRVKAAAVAFRPSVAVYSGASPVSMAAVPCVPSSDDASRCEVRTTPGQRYWIQVGRAAADGLTSQTRAPGGRIKVDIAVA